MRFRRLLPATRLTLLLPLAALAGCDQGPKGDADTRTTYVRTLVSLPGEDELLRMEEERWSGNGRLKALLTDRNAATRARAALAAGRVGDRSLEPEIQKLFTDGDDEVRASAAWAAGQLGDPALAAGLETLFADASAEVRKSALVARSLLGGETPAALVSALAATGPDAAAQAALGAAVVAAARFDDPGLSGKIAPLLAHPDAEIRWRAAYALQRHGREGAALLGALRDADHRVRAYAALGLGAARDVDAVDGLIALLADSSNDVSAAAATALGQLRDGRAAEALVALSRSEIPRRRFAAIDALVVSGLSPPALGELTEDPNPWLRALAIDGLRRIKAGGRYLAKAAKDPEWQVRAAAARAYADAGDSNRLADLQYDADARVIPPVLEGLSRLDYRGLDTVLLKHLNDKDPVVRATAARLLGGRRADSAIDALAASYERSRLDEILDARLAILDALAKEGGTDKVLGALRLGVSDPHRLVRERAWALLGRLNATEGVTAPGRVASLKTDNYYRDLAARGDFVFHLNIETPKGTIVFNLYPKEAALTVRFLDEVCSANYYDDRVITHIDPPLELGDGDDRGDGRGYFGTWAPDESTRRPFEKIHLTLARPLGRDSGNSQFLITLLPRPDLDGFATNVGELVSGGELLDQLGPGDAISSIRISTGEYKGRFEERRVEVAVAQDSPAPGTEEVVRPGGWQRPPALLYMAIVGGVMLVLSLLPLLVSSEKREDFPAALGVVVILILLVAGVYTWMVFEGDYYAALTSSRPGPKILDKPNPPVMSHADAELACTGAMGWVMLNLALLWFLINGRSFSRWLFVFLSLIEIAAFTAQISTKLPLLYVLSQVGIVINLFKIWFLVMDRQTKEYLAPE